jgi:hypothetical protein
LTEFDQYEKKAVGESPPPSFGRKRAADQLLPEDCAPLLGVKQGKTVWCQTVFSCSADQCDLPLAHAAGDGIL